MLYAIGLTAVLLTTPLDLQNTNAFTGTWRAVDTAMGGGGDSVPSPMELSSRTAMVPSMRELIIAEQTEAVAVARGSGQGWLLPFTGVAVQTVDHTGRAIVAKVHRDGAALVIRTEQRVPLPGGAEVLVETEDRHVLLSDGSLQVTTVAKSGSVTQSRQLTYQRAR